MSDHDEQFKDRKKRRSRLILPPLIERLPLRPSERDTEIVRHVFDHRFLLKDHLVALTGGDDSSVRKRLARLWQHEYVLRRTDPIKSALHQPLIYHLGKNGARLLRETTDLNPDAINQRLRHDRELGPYFLRHALMIAHIQVIFNVAVRAHPSIKLLFWRHDKEVTDRVSVGGDPIFEDERDETWPIVPDAYFGLQLPEGTWFCMLEADRATAELDRFKKKLRAYFLWWKYGSHTKKLNINRFIVLTVAETRDRAGELFKLSRDVDDQQKGSGMFWFTWNDFFNLEKPQQALGDIWMSWKNGQPAKVALMK